MCRPTNFCIACCPAVVIYYSSDPSSFSCPLCKAVYIGNGAGALPTLSLRCGPSAKPVQSAVLEQHLDLQHRVLFVMQAPSGAWRTGSRCCLSGTPRSARTTRPSCFRVGGCSVACRDCSQISFANHVSGACKWTPVLTALPTRSHALQMTTL